MGRRIIFIDAKDDLSIQVHTSYEYALMCEGQCGKTEKLPEYIRKPESQTLSSHVGGLIL